MAHPRGSGRKRSYSLDRAHVSALHARYTTEDDVSAVHNDGVRHPLPIVGDEGTGGEALGVVRKIHVQGGGCSAQGAKATGIEKNGSGRVSRAHGLRWLVTRERAAEPVARVREAL